MLNYPSLSSLVFTGSGTIVFLFMLFLKQGLSSALPFALDFWMGAGLIKLSGNPDWITISTVAMIVILRKLVTLRLKTLPES